MNQQSNFTTQPQQPVLQDPVPQPESFTFTRDEYRNVVKEAYNEGIQDAKSSMPQDGIDREKQKKEGKESAIEKHAKEKEEARQRFRTVAKRHDIELLHAKTVFPFTFFPDDFVLDTTKLTIVQTAMFQTDYVTTIPLKDIADVELQTLWFLGSLNIKYMPQASSPGVNQIVDVRIANLKREDAVLAKNLLKGAMVAKAEEIDITKLSPEEIVQTLEKFGETHGVI